VQQIVVRAVSCIVPAAALLERQIILEPL
jgi:hypothetical protein